MQFNAQTWQNVIEAVAEEENHTIELVEAAVTICGRTWFEHQSQDAEDLHNAITAYITEYCHGTYNGSAEELYNLLTGESLPRYFDADQWQFDLECEGWNFEPVTLDTYAAFRP
jgi:hypothetical protein